jgi:hypothetical protein
MYIDHHYKVERERERERERESHDSFLLLGGMMAGCIPEVVGSSWNNAV